MGTVLIDISNFSVIDSSSCTLLFDGQNVDCLQAGTLSFQVAYNTPYQLTINFSAPAGQFGWNGQGSPPDFPVTNWSYFIRGAQGNFAPVPEPGSSALMVTGLLGAVEAVRRKFKM